VRREEEAQGSEHRAEGKNEIEISKSLGEGSFSFKKRRQATGVGREEEAQGSEHRAQVEEQPAPIYRGSDEPTEGSSPKANPDIPKNEGSSGA